MLTRKLSEQLCNSLKCRLKREKEKSKNKEKKRKKERKKRTWKGRNVTTIIWCNSCEIYVRNLRDLLIMISLHLAFVQSF